ncbi:MAG: hypothetical protein NVSMB38_14320 [Ktedonobacteraceae bacterium]
MKTQIGSIPPETVRLAQAACPKATLAMRLREALGELSQDEQLVALSPVEGQPGYAPWRLAVVTVLQYTEHLTDRQAANAGRERLDWKYALGLDLSDAGFDASLEDNGFDQSHFAINGTIKQATCLSLVCRFWLPRTLSISSLNCYT